MKFYHNIFSVNILKFKQGFANLQFRCMYPPRIEFFKSKKHTIPLTLLFDSFCNDLKDLNVQ